MQIPMTSVRRAAFGALLCSGILVGSSMMSVAGAQPAPPDVTAEETAPAPGPVADTPCAASIRTISENSPAAAEITRGHFLCAGEVTTLSGETQNGEERSVIGNIATGATTDITGTGPEARQTQLSGIGVEPTPETEAVPPPAARAAEPPGAGTDCYPTDSDDYNLVRTDYQASALMTLCYGEYIWMGGTPGEIIWSDITNLDWRYTLTQRNFNDFSVRKTSFGDRDINLHIGWDVRKNVVGGQDNEVAFGSFDAPQWSTVSDYGPYTLTPLDVSQGTYFTTLREIEVEDYFTASNFVGVINHELPRWTCPKGATVTCKFP